MAHHDNEGVLPPDGPVVGIVRQDEHIADLRAGSESA